MHLGGLGRAPPRLGLRPCVRSEGASALSTSVSVRLRMTVAEKLKRDRNAIWFPSQLLPAVNAAFVPMKIVFQYYPHLHSTWIAFILSLFHFFFLFFFKD